MDIQQSLLSFGGADTPLAGVLGPKGGPDLAALDADKDGAVSLSEFKGAFEAGLITPPAAITALGLGGDGAFAESLFGGLADGVEAYLEETARGGDAEDAAEEALEALFEALAADADAQEDAAETADEAIGALEDTLAQMLNAEDGAETLAASDALFSAMMERVEDAFADVFDAFLDRGAFSEQAFAAVNGEGDGAMSPEEVAAAGAQRRDGGLGGGLGGLSFSASAYGAPLTQVSLQPGGFYA